MLEEKAIDSVAVAPAGCVWPNDHTGCVPLGVSLSPVRPPGPQGRTSWGARQLPVYARSNRECEIADGPYGWQALASAATGAGEA
jgi:hypothetical protein